LGQVLFYPVGALCWLISQKGVIYIKKIISFYKSNSSDTSSYRITIFGLFHMIGIAVEMEQGIQISIIIAIYKYGIGINFGNYNSLW